jgi:hypothetical protein
MRRKLAQYERAKHGRTALGAVWEASVESKDHTVIVSDEEFRDCFIAHHTSSNEINTKHSIQSKMCDRYLESLD